jgi:hypothetical protein
MAVDTSRHFITLLGGWRRRGRNDSVSFEAVDNRQYSKTEGQACGERSRRELIAARAARAIAQAAFSFWR